MTTLLFDCDGVLADTERHGHLPAFNQAFEEFNLPIRWSEAEYAERVKIGGGKERIASALPASNGDDHRDLVARIHRRKTAHYLEIVRSGRLPARPGIRRLVDEALRADWTLAVASTSAEESVRGVLEHAVGPDRAAQFAVFAGDAVPRKKPDPAIYALALSATGSSPATALAIEDSRNGLLAAVRAGLRCVVTVNDATRDESMAEALMVTTSLGDPGDPMEVLANRSPIEPNGYLTLADLEACLA